MKILLVGGSKSGKSGLAQRLCVRLAAGAPMIYWATMEPVDGEDRARIARHLDERAGWGFSTVECGRALERAALPERACVLFDSVTALLANEMFSGAQPDARSGQRRSCWRSAAVRHIWSASATIFSAMVRPMTNGRSATAAALRASAAR